MRLISVTKGRVRALWNQPPSYFRYFMVVEGVKS
jgi:hypothetical protein